VVSLLLGGVANTEATDKVRRRERGLREEWLNSTYSLTEPYQGLGIFSQYKEFSIMVLSSMSSMWWV